MAKRLSFGMGKPDMADPSVLPESRRHNAADAPEFPPELAGLHFSGVPAESFPSASWPHLRVSNSDEAKAVSDVGKKPYGMAGSVSPRDGRTGPDPVSVANPENFDKALEERYDFRRSEAEAQMAPDILLQKRNAHVPDGWKARYQTAPAGHSGGMLNGFAVMKDDAGNPVRVNELVLTAQPADIAEKVQQRHEAQAEQFMAEVYAKARAESGGRLVPTGEDTFAREQGGVSRAL